MKERMKRIIVCLIIVSMVFMIGCGKVKTIDGVTYDTYGLISESEKRNPDIEYRVIIGNIVWACILVETIVAPIYFIGWSMYEPVGVLNKNKPKGSV